MKIDFNDEKIIVYLYEYTFSFDNKEKLNTEIKNIFLKLIKKYYLNLYGFNRVIIYENKIYGCIMEIERLGVDNFYPEVIDLKIVVYNDVSFAFEFSDDIFLMSYDGIYMKNNKYYIDIKNDEDIIKYIEYGKIIYKI